MLQDEEGKSWNTFLTKIVQKSQRQEAREVDVVL